MNMHHGAHPWWQQTYGCWLMVLGWALQDPQWVLRGRCERLLGEIAAVRRRVGATSHDRLSVASQTL